MNDGKQLYEYAVLHRDPEGPTTIVVDKSSTLSGSAKVAEMEAIRTVPEQYVENLEELDIVVKPFASTGAASLNVDAFLAKNPGSYVRDFNFDDNTYRVVVMTVANGKGYAPVDVLERGDVALAARIAAAAFEAGL